MILYYAKDDHFILSSDFEEEEVFWYYDMKDNHDDGTKAITKSLWECLNTHKLQKCSGRKLCQKRKLHEEQ